MGPAHGLDVVGDRRMRSAVVCGFLSWVAGRIVV